MKQTEESGKLPSENEMKTGEFGMPSNFIQRRGREGMSLRTRLATSKEAQPSGPDKKAAACRLLTQIVGKKGRSLNKEKVRGAQWSE